MRFSLGSRTGRTLLHQCSYPEPRVAVQVTRHTTQDTGSLDTDADYVVPGVVSEARGGCGAEESGVTVSSPEDSLVGGFVDGGFVEGVSGAGEDGAVEVGGGSVDALTDGEGLAGGWVLWSLPPVSPRCRAIQS